MQWSLCLTCFKYCCIPALIATFLVHSFIAHNRLILFSVVGALEPIPVATGERQVASGNWAKTETDEKNKN